MAAEESSTCKHPGEREAKNLPYRMGWAPYTVRYSMEQEILLELPRCVMPDSLSCPVCRSQDVAIRTHTKIAVICQCRVCRATFTVDPERVSTSTS